MPARTPEETGRLLAQALNEGDLDAAVALYERNASFVPRDGPVVVGSAGIRQAISELLAPKPSFDLTVEKTVPGGDDDVLLYSRWTMTGAGNTGKVKTRGIELVRRQPDGSWLFAIDDPFALGTG